jgi:hypothetical protein
VVVIRNLSAGDSPSIAENIAITIRGKVLDEENNPIPGVAVKLKGSSLAVATDATGSYVISVPDETAILVFSFIGYEPQERVVASSKTIDIVLKQSHQHVG